MNELTLQQFKNHQKFSKKSFFNRLAERPIFTIKKVSFSKIYQSFFKDRPYKIKGQTFWGDRMIQILPEDASLFHWKVMPGEEENLTEYILNTVEKNSTVFDIGAHHGYYSLLLSKIVGSNGHVYSFEPTPSTASVLRANTHDKKNITIEEKAMWSEDTKLNFIDYGPGFRAYNGFDTNDILEKFYPSRQKKDITIQAIYLDKYVQEKKLNPKFIKLDVEGAEYQALLGMRQTLINHKPIISVEFFVNKNWSERNNDILNFFTEINFEAFHNTNGVLKKFSGRETVFPHEYANIIFIKK